MFDKRITIFTGHFGSGKTEVALNYIMEMSKYYSKTAIVDFDIVNPYFRTADAKAELEKRNIIAIVPVYANTNVDVPALPPQINMVFENKEYRAVFDVGGDDIGARVLVRYRESIFADDYEMLFVVNTRRPMTDSPDKIIDIMKEIENSSMLKIGGLINNTNVLQYTTGDDVLQGYEIIKEVSLKTGVPIKFTSVLGDFGCCISMPDKDIFQMNKFIHLPWQ